MEDSHMKNEKTVYVGASTHDIDLFEGQYIVPNGMAYNSYLVLDEKTLLFDTVDNKVKNKWLENIDSALNGRTLDFLVVSHMEPDHSSNIVTIANRFPNLKIIGNQKTFALLKNFFGWDFEDRKIVVKDGDTFSTGTRTFKFVFAPMIHWPEVMMTVDETEKILFSADAFGKFGALDAQEEWACEARRYYFNIVGKYGVQVQNILKKLGGNDITTICPLHGPILQENLSYYLSLYDTWSAYKPEVEGVFIAYTSIYGNTKKAVMMLKDMLEKENIRVSISDLNRSDMAENIEDAFKHSHLVVATTTYDGDIFSAMKDFLSHLQAKNFQNRTVGIIENGSWAPQAGKIIKSTLQNSKNLNICNTIVSIHSALSETNINELQMLKNELLLGVNAHGKL